MKNYVFRNFTIEHLFSGLDVKFSGYNEVSGFKDEYDRIIWFYELDPVFTESEAIEELQEQLKLVKYLFDNDTVNCNVILMVPDIRNNLTFIEDLNVNFILSQIIDAYREIAKRRKNVNIVFLSDFFNRYDSAKISWKYFYSARMIIPPSVTNEFKNWFLSKISSLELNRKKCLVLDCDNTLWGGIIGEDGLSGIDLGQSTLGKVFSDFQRLIKFLYDSGVIITLCSKNNELDVWEVFERHPEMILTKDMIAAYEINWNNKADNIVKIKNKLNIGLDAIVFVDDSPFERNLVQKILPDVSVVNFFTNEWTMYSELRSQLVDFFSLKTLTNEDKSKTIQYHQKLKRDQFESNFNSIDDYIASLAMKLKISMIDEFSISRASQMTQKTNQFNLTTKRYTESDILALQKSGADIHVMSVSDRFGDSGITGLIMLNGLNNPSASILEIDTLLLSCRVLGRGIENEFVKSILNFYFEKGITEIKATYVKSNKNQQTSTFYNAMGFKETSKTDLQIDYSIKLSKKLLIDPRYEITFN